MFKRFLEIIRWVPRAPTNITNEVPEGTVCNYCGSDKSLWNYEGVYCICQHCQKKIADIVLRDEKLSQ